MPFPASPGPTATAQAVHVRCLPFMAAPSAPALVAPVLVPELLTNHRVFFLHCRLAELAGDHVVVAAVAHVHGDARRSAGPGASPSGAVVASRPLSRASPRSAREVPVDSSFVPPPLSCPGRARSDSASAAGAVGFDPAASARPAVARAAGASPSPPFRGSGGSRRVLGALGRGLLLLLEQHRVELRERGLEVPIERLSLLVGSLCRWTFCLAVGSWRCLGRGGGLFFRCGRGGVGSRLRRARGGRGGLRLGTALGSTAREADPKDPHRQHGPPAHRQSSGSWQDRKASRMPRGRKCEDPRLPTALRV